MKFKTLILSFFILFNNNAIADLVADSTSNFNVDYNTPKTYILEEISVKGEKYVNKIALVNLTGLEIGKEILIPGEDISNAVKKLWKEGLFSDIKINIAKVIDQKVFLEIIIEEEIRLSKFKFEGKISKSNISSIKEELKLMRGNVLTKNLINNSINQIKDFFIKKGYYKSSITTDQIPDSSLANSAILIFKIKKGEKVKIKDITIKGRAKRLNIKKSFWNKNDSIYSLNNKEVRKCFKETKIKKWWRFWKSSKFISENYEDEKIKLIEKYNEKGYRDAKILSDTVVYNSLDNTLSIYIDIYEGKPYFFGNINWTGNTLYDNNELSRILGIKKGEIFDQSILNTRLFQSAEGNDVSSLYLDDGYLFFNARPLEVSTKNNTINLDIRIYEGEQAKINKVTVKGNTKTNDHVIIRELRTNPGDLFKRSDIMRSQRELNNLQYFDPEKFDVKIDPDPQKNTVDITYIVSEKSTDQINLQGGYGAQRIVGSLGFRFSNFSSKKIFNAKAWSPLPSGDGQSLSISASSNGVYYQNYNIGFTEPWLGGKKPNSLSFSLFKSISSNGLSGNQRQSVEVTGLIVGLGKRLKIPDDYFTFYNGISIQQYKLNNSSSFFSFSNGYSNNISYSIELGRNSVDQLIFPRSGSKFSLSLKITPPYSKFDNISDYSNISDQERYRWVEYYKWKFKSTWYSAFTDKLVLGTKIEMALLGAYNNNLGVSPFERFYVGGDGFSGMGYINDGRELIALRGYANNSLSPSTGATIYNKYTTELRYALSLNPTSTVYILSFIEAGNAWESFDYYDPFSVKRSAGFGLRITLPMLGMMGLDYGWGFDDIIGQSDANGGRFHFSFNQQF